MKIIFLDIDGVLQLCRPERDEYGRLFHEHFVENLRRIIKETGAKIVISSTWRLSGEVIMLEMWEKRDLPGEIIGITPHIDICERGKEIQYFLDNSTEEIENYVILDDDSDMLDNQLDNFVQTSKNNDHEDCVDDGYGLTSICTEKAIEILNR